MKESAMSTIEPTADNAGADASHTAAISSRSELWLPTLLSLIAGMVDLIGFLGLGIFTAHVTGNIVVVGALIVRHNPGADPSYSRFYPRRRRYLADCQG